MTTAREAVVQDSAAELGAVVLSRLLRSDGRTCMHTSSCSNRSMTAARRGAACVLAVLAVAWPCLSCAQSSAPKWSVHEISLTASKTYANPYTETGVTAVFQGPNGLEKTVSGFWDGGTTFKIRLTPQGCFTVKFPTQRSANLIWLRVHVKPSSGNLFFIVNRR